MSFRKFSAIVPDVLSEIERMIAREKRGRKREGVQACNACDPVVENRPVYPRKRVGRAMRVRGGEQLELQLQKTIRRN